jgi:hypothetical protein
MLRGAVCYRFVTTPEARHAARTGAIPARLAAEATPGDDA